MTSQTIIIRGGIHREIDVANAALRLAKLDPAKAWNLDVSPRDASATLEQNSGVWKLYALIAATFEDSTFVRVSLDSAMRDLFREKCGIGLRSLPRAAISENVCPVPLKSASARDGFQFTTT